MYNIDHISNYSTDEEYRNAILNVFKLTEFSETNINTCIDQIFTTINKHDDFYKLKPLLQRLATQFFSEDLQLGFMIMFCYDYFLYTHKLVCDFYTFNIIKDCYIDEIYKIIGNNGK